MELKWKDLILTRLSCLASAIPAWLKRVLARPLPEAVRPAPFPFGCPTRGPWRRKGPSLAALAKDPSRFHFATGPRQVAGLNRSSCCNAVR